MITVHSLYPKLSEEASQGGLIRTVGTPRLEFLYGRSLSWHVLYVYRTRETGNIYVTFVAVAWWRDDLISLIFPTELGGSC
jgi:hypothetical protein